MHGHVHEVEMGIIIKGAISHLLKREVEIEACADSQTLFNVVRKKRSTTERRLQIDVHALNERYQKAELKRIFRIQGRENVTNVMTKEIIPKETRMWG